MPGLFVFVLGLGIGSFINAWVYRLHTGQGIVLERSVCPNCHRRLAPFDLLPILSFFLLNGRCRFCHHPISWQYPVVELSVGLLFLFFFSRHFGLHPGLELLSMEASYSVALWQFIRDCAAVLFLTTLFVFDLRYGELPDRVTVPAIVVFGLTNFFGGMAWEQIILGLVVGAAFFGLQYAASRGRWIGSGDIRLGAAMGVLLGPVLLIEALFMAYIVGAILALALIALKRKTMKSTMPFGVFLTGAALLVLAYGQPLLDRYLQLIS